MYFVILPANFCPVSQLQNIRKIGPATLTLGPWLWYSKGYSRSCWDGRLRTSSRKIVL